MPISRSETAPHDWTFAFTVLDDTDVATVENVKPVYDLLARLGMRTTKTVWPVGCPEGSDNYAESQTLEDPDYLEFVLGLQRAGFEITWHGATMESSRRERTLLALERFRELFGEYPRVHANHALNRENVYWGLDRIDDPLLRLVYRRMLGHEPDFYQGHREGSAYYWGDACNAHVSYVRNLTFSHINTRRHNPTLPYRDPTRPIGNWWFSASDAEDADEFAHLIGESMQDALVAERGVCIVATHFGKGFVRGGQVVPEVQRLLERLAARPGGWFPTVSELLDDLRERNGEAELSASEWRRMQWRWARDLATRKLRRRLGRTTAR